MHFSLTRLIAVGIWPLFLEEVQDCMLLEELYLWLKDQHLNAVVLQLLLWSHCGTFAVFSWVN